MNLQNKLDDKNAGKVDGWFLLTVLFISGFVLMGFEMLGSRYLNPYFGGGITTWACLISTVLFAMMLGYLFGGNLADRLYSVVPLSLAFAGSALYIFLVAYLADSVLLYIIDNIGDGFFGVALGSIFLTAVPVFLLSACSPYVVRLMLVSAAYGGRVTGKVYAVSTAGNILGTLFTTFTLIPMFGSRSITKIFSLILVLLAVAVFIRYREAKTSVAPALLLPFLLLGSVSQNEANAASKNVMIEAAYPEGPVFHGDGLYFGEMAKDQVSVLTPVKRSVFFYQKGCGPTSVVKLSNGFAANCHLGSKVVFLNDEGKLVREVTGIPDETKFTNPNDITSDGVGGVIISDPGSFSQNSNYSGRVFHIDKDYKVTLIHTGFHYPNGVAYRKKDHVLFVNEHLGRNLWKLSLDENWQVKETIKILSSAQLLNAVQKGCNQGLAGWPNYSGPDGVRIHPNGEIYLAMYGLSSVLRLSLDNNLHCHNVEIDFPTSMAFSKTKIAVTGALDIYNDPKGGAVMISDFNRF